MSICIYFSSNKALKKKKVYLSNSPQLLNFLHMHLPLHDTFINKLLLIF